MATCLVVNVGSVCGNNKKLAVKVGASMDSSYLPYKPVCLISLPAYQPACLPAYQPACLPAYQPACLPACLPTSLPAYQPACLPACPPCL
jgi:hypothetical protein